MRNILDIVKPAAQARYGFFYSPAQRQENDIFYDVHNMCNMRQKPTILAYEMNASAASDMRSALAIT